MAAFGAEVPWPKSGLKCIFQQNRKYSLLKLRGQSVNSRLQSIHSENSFGFDIPDEFREISQLIRCNTVIYVKTMCLSQFGIVS